MKQPAQTRSRFILMSHASRRAGSQELLGGSLSEEGTWTYLLVGLIEI
jgi:hypothetical protein